MCKVLILVRMCKCKLVMSAGLTIYATTLLQALNVPHPGTPQNGAVLFDIGQVTGLLTVSGDVDRESFARYVVIVKVFMNIGRVTGMQTTRLSVVCSCILRKNIFCKLCQFIC